MKKNKDGSVYILDWLNANEEKLLKPVKDKLWLHLLIGFALSLVIAFIGYSYTPQQMSKVGGTLVGLAVSIEVVSHWLTFKAGNDKAKRLSLTLVTVAGIPALMGTLLWTFGSSS